SIGVDASDDVIIGNNALPASSGAPRNTVVGSEAFGGVGSGRDNAIFGYKAVNQAWNAGSTNYNSVFGSMAGYNLGFTNGGTNFNTLLGYQAGFNVDSEIGRAH